mgnify:CR=1 FL=1
MNETPIWLTTLLAIPPAFFAFFEAIITGLLSLFGGA